MIGRRDWMTLREKIIVETYTGVCMLTGDDSIEVYKYMAEIMGRPVFSHELADQKVVEDLKEISKHDFMVVCSKKEADDRLKAMKPVFKERKYESFVDYENGTGECILNKYIYFECPSCGGFVGEKYPHINRAQHKCEYCPKCGKAIDWSGEDE